MSASLNRFECKFAGQCGGCPNIAIAYEQQLLQKKDRLQNLVRELGYSSEVKIFSLGPGYLRDRCDLTLYYQDGKRVLGLYDLQRKKIIDLSECHQMSPNLWSAVERLRSDLPPINLGSIRVRISPSGQIGLWLDFPNVSIKELLDERAWFLRTLKWAFVEIGQKRKSLKFEDGKHKLAESDYLPWFETYVGHNLEPFPLYTKVGSFSQPGFKANKKLIEIIRDLLPQANMSILELCSGSGNFSFFLASVGHHVHGVEMDAAALEASERSIQNFKWKEHLHFEKLNLHAKNPKVKDLFENKDLVLADPPRSGLGASLDFLDRENAPKYFLYISCFPQSFVKDCKKLESYGYRLKQVLGLDQFPQSEHIESIALLEK